MDKRNLKKSAQHTTPLSFSGYFDSRCLRWRGLKHVLLSLHLLGGSFFLGLMGVVFYAEKVEE